MSGFTDAFLVMPKDKQAAEKALVHYPYSYLARDLNAQWFAIFPEHVDYSLQPFLDWMLKRSTFPMLYFQYPSDHGWGYNLYDSGKERAFKDAAGVSDLNWMSYHTLSRK